MKIITTKRILRHIMKITNRYNTELPSISLCPKQLTYASELKSTYNCLTLSRDKIDFYLSQTKERYIYIYMK